MASKVGLRIWMAIVKVEDYANRLIIVERTIGSLNRQLR